MTPDPTLAQVVAEMRDSVQTYGQTSEDSAGGYCSGTDAMIDDWANRIESALIANVRAEPVAWMHPADLKVLTDNPEDFQAASGHQKGPLYVPLYTAPPAAANPAAAKTEGGK